MTLIFLKTLLNSKWGTLGHMHARTTSLYICKMSHLSLENAETNFLQSRFLRLWFGLQEAD